MSLASPYRRYLESLPPPPREPIDRTNKATVYIDETINCFFELQHCMYSMLRKRFHRITIHLVKCPAFKHLRREIKRLVKSLRVLRKLIRKNLHVLQVKHLEQYLYWIHPKCEQAIVEGGKILEYWQTPEVDVDRKARKIQRHDMYNSKDRVKELVASVRAADMAIRAAICSRMAKEEKRKPGGPLCRGLRIFHKKTDSSSVSSNHTNPRTPGFVSTMPSQFGPEASPQISSSWHSRSQEQVHSPRPLRQQGSSGYRASQSSSQRQPSSRYGGLGYGASVAVHGRSRTGGCRVGRRSDSSVVVRNRHTRHQTV